MSEQIAAPARAKKPKEQSSGDRAWLGPPLLAGGEYQDGSFVANLLGLQLARIATVSANWRRRRRPVDADLRSNLEAYERDGYVVIEDFLPEDVFATIQAECRSAHADGLFSSHVEDDNNVIEESLAVKKHLERFPVTSETLSENDLLKRFAAALLRRPSIERMRLDVNFMTKSKDAPPPERLVGTNYLHADVHYPSGKAWLYLNDIDEENGAFVYCKGSHKLNPARLAYEYDISVRVARAKKTGGFRTSTMPGNLLRLPTERQMRAMRIEETTASGRANTLVFANVMGFHKRGEFAEGRRREQIQIQFHDRPALRR